jgi:hypothetical protein
MIAGSKLYEPSAASRVPGGISGMRSFISRSSTKRKLTNEKYELHLVICLHYDKGIDSQSKQE